MGPACLFCYISGFGFEFYTFVLIMVVTTFLKCVIMYIASEIGDNGLELTCARYKILWKTECLNRGYFSSKIVNHFSLYSSHRICSYFCPSNASERQIPFSYKTITDKDVISDICRETSIVLGTGLRFSN